MIVDFGFLNWKMKKMLSALTIDSLGRFASPAD
jgi:hypothetical protein